MRPSCRLVPVVILACCMLAPAGRTQEVKPEEAKAVRIIWQLFGTVTRDDSRPGRPVVEVELFESHIDDSHLPLLKSFTSLRILSMGATAVTDAGLANLQGLTNLEELDVRSSDITTRGLLQLRGLP